MADYTGVINTQATTLDVNYMTNFVWFVAALNYSANKVTILYPFGTSPATGRTL